MKDIILFMLKSVAACALIALAAWVGWRVWYANSYTPEERAMIEEVRLRLDAELFGDKRESARTACACTCGCARIAATVETHRATHDEVREFDVKVVAETIWLEARGEGERGIRAVASVIRNRSVERGLSPREVCLERGQFSCWRKGLVLPSNKVRESRMMLLSTRLAWMLCVEVAEELVNSKFHPTINANHYYNPDKCRPSWGRKMRSCIYIGRHKFGRV